MSCAWPALLPLRQPARRCCLGRCAPRQPSSAFGSLEMGAIGVGLMNWVPEMSITDAPFLWKTRAQCWNAISGAFGDELRKRSLDKGFVLSGWTDLGFRSMTNNKHPINSVKDM